MKPIITFVLATILVGYTLVPPASADSTAQDVAYGTGSVFSTLVYAPLKGAFCIVGAVTSGLTLPFGGPQTAERVATRACGGTWAITPDALKGREPVRFLGGNGSSPRTAEKR